MSIFNILASIKNDKSTKAKEKILMDNKDNMLLKKIFYLVYNKQINFGIRELPDSFWVSEMPFIRSDDSALERAVDGLVEELSTRRLTGNDAISWLAGVRRGLDSEHLDIIRRILNRNLECGVGSTLPNKVWKDLIPKQKQMLCNPFTAKNLKKIKYPAISQVKEDGARCFAECALSILYDEGMEQWYYEVDSISFMTRNGNEYETIHEIAGDINGLIYSLPNGVDHNVTHITFDGELVVVDEHNNTLPREIGNGILNKMLKGTNTDEEEMMVRFKVWDMYFHHEQDKRPYMERFNLLHETIQNLNDLNNDFDVRKPFIQLVDTIVVHNENLARHHSLDCIAKGLEGTILKNMDAKWKDGRSADQVKFKEEIMVDLRVVGFIENKSVDFKNTLGSLMLESECGKIKVNCGSGFTNTQAIKNKDGSWTPVPLEDRPDSDRELIWSKRDELLGSIVEVKCNALTTSETKDGYSLFLPIFQGFRYDKSEANTLEEVFGEQ